MTTKVITINPTVDTSVAYSNKDCIGTKITIPNVFPVNNKGIVRGFVYSDEASQSTVLNLIIFASDPSLTTFTDNSPLAIDDTDLRKIIGVVSITAGTASTFVDNELSVLSNLYIPLESSSSTLYACLMAGATQHYVVANDVQLKLYIDV